MNYYAAPPIVGTFAFGLLSLIVFSSKPKTNEKLLFSILCLETFFWQLIWFISFFLTDSNHISLSAKVAYIPITFLPFTFFHFIVVSVKRPSDYYLVRIFYALAIILVASLFTTNYFIVGHNQFEWGNFAAAGPIFPVFTICAIAAMLRGVYILYDSTRKEASLFKRNQKKYLLFGLLLYFFCVVDFPQVYGYSGYPIGSIFFLLSFSLISYAITVHNILDIDVLIKRATVFTGLFICSYGVLSFFVLLGQKVFERVFGWSDWVALLPSVLLITISLRPLEEYLTAVTDRYLFQKKYDYKELLRIFTTEVITYLELDKVAVNTVQGLNNIIKLESVSIWTLRNDNKIFDLMSYEGNPPIEKQISSENKLISQLNKTLKYSLRSSQAVGGNSDVDILSGFNIISAEVLLPIIFRQDLVGLIALGHKKSGDVYRAEELPLLMSIANTVGIAISNAKLYTELSTMQAEAAQKDKMAVIGTLAAGINHEICNPLGIVRGQSEMFLLNQKDGLFDKLSPEKVIAQATKIFEKVIKETDRATGITKRLSTFAKPSNMFNMEPVQISAEINEVLELLRTEMRVDNIIVKNKIPADFPSIMVDKKQLQQVTFNIIRNAAQAMPESGEIIVGGSRNGTKASVSIRDTGHGISEDKLKNIFHPFFTTKDPGKGTGLGLFIVKQIVEKNHGTIHCESEFGKGTVFTLTFQIAKEDMNSTDKVESIA
ncbi:MAG: two-component system NtrC family sensor kinase [Candidatus Omnitrophota bacterium]|jgi:two-component system NtrC family sensor kinase